MPSKTSKKPPRPDSAIAHAAIERRKEERRTAQDARHAANVAAGKTPKRRKPKAQNMKYCDRCGVGGPRLIVCGSVCWCASIGAAREGWRIK